VHHVNIVLHKLSNFYEYIYHEKYFYEIAAIEFAHGIKLGKSS